MQRTILLLIGLFTSCAHAEVYKWKDENNHTHYSSVPPMVNHNSISMDNCNKKCNEERIHEAKIIKRRLKSWESWENKIDKIRRKSKRKSGADGSISNRTVNPTFY